MRKAQRIIKSIQAHEGAGFVVNRPFPVPGLSEIDPFLLIDEIGPVNYRPGEAIGAPDHPHRGFETISYIFEGGVFHEDSNGSSTELEKGDMQWMTAGRGVVHSELPSKRITEKGGLFHATQIWVNLPKKKKFVEPKYQNIRANEIPTLHYGGGTSIKLFSGTLEGVTGPVQNQTPILYALVELAPGARWTSQSVHQEWTTLAYVISGKGIVAGENNVERTDLVHFSNTSGELVFENQSRTELFKFYLLAGAPLNEPIARMGPFVMNTRKELEEAYDDFMSGRISGGFGKIQRNGPKQQ